MNKYQKHLIDLSSFYYYNKKTIPCLINEEIVIQQDEDITITKYLLSISNEFIQKAYSIKGDSITELTKKESYLSSKTFHMELDFENQIDAIKIEFINNLADDLILPVIYKEADKEAYYAKKEQEYKNNLLKTADIKVSTGADLVNIYFQPCCDKYEYTEIQLYIPKEFVTVGGPYGPVQKPSSWSMIKKCKVDPEEFYKSINGLANGKYSFILKQYDKENVIILETGYIEFTISKPKTHGIMPRINRI